MKVAVLADFKEEGWSSMDLVAEMLISHLETVERDATEGSHPVSVELLRPKMKFRLAKHNALTQTKANKLARNVDRVMNRFMDYPRHLRPQVKQFDIFHLTDHSYSQLVHTLPPRRTVVTCHDVDTFRCLWETSNPLRDFVFRAMTRRILAGFQKAAHICCDSQATQDELIDRRLAPLEKTSVVRLGLQPCFTKPHNQAATERIDSLIGARAQSPVEILHVGTTIPRKRIDVLLKVFAGIRREIDPNARLLRVGGAFTSEQLAMVNRLGLDMESVRVLPFLSPMELAALYRRATLVLVPSDAEGFGLPVIEALACGTPVLASDLSVLREVGGDAASYARVGDVPEWIARVRALLRERLEEPNVWEDRRRRAHLQGNKFNWSETASRMVEIYREVMAASV